MKWSTLLSLLHGAATTMGISVVGIGVGVPLGLLIALARVWRVPVIAQLLTVYVSLVRAAPLVTFSMLIFFGLPVLGLSLKAIPAALISLALNTAAFNSEIWRATIVDFPRDQLEAAKAMGMTGRLAFRRIVLPQIWRASLPALVNEMTFLIKGTPAVGVLGVVDLTSAARQVAANTYEPLPPYLVATVLYGTVVAVLVRAARSLEEMVQRRYGLL